MRRGTMILAVALIALAGIGAGAYNAGERNGLEQQIETIETTTADGTEVVQVVGPADLDGRGYRGHGGVFPFGFLLFPLFIIGTIVLVKALVWGGPGRHWRGPGGPGMWGPGPGGPDEGWRSRADAWHRDMHEPHVTRRIARATAGTGRRGSLACMRAGLRTGCTDRGGDRHGLRLVAPR